MVELEKRVRREEVFVNRMEDMSRKRVNFLSFLSLHPSSVVNRTTSTGVFWVGVESWMECVSV